MALSILDGNQTATTLSTVISAGAHIPAHTVVSLGSQAITDMRSAVSGSVVSISNLPATQTIAGTVTANLSDTNLNTVTIGVRGTVTASGLVNATGADNSTLVPGFPIVFNDAIAEQPEFRQINVANPLPVRAFLTTVTVGNSVTIGSLPAISGTVTANLSSVPTHGVTIANSSVTVNGTFYQATQPVSLASLPSLAAGSAQIGSVTASISGTVPVSGTFWQATQPISGTVTANVSGTVPVSGTFYQATQPVSLASLPSLAAGTAQIGSVTASISGTPTVTMGAISGTVTATIVSTTVTVSALPSGALTTRFGSVTTANTAQITTAVTNTSRKYLLCQNISSGTVTIGIGFSPTTTQGIQLTSGAGLTFDSFCPTGAVYWLGATTGANWTILEG